MIEEIAKDKVVEQRDKVDVLSLDRFANVGYLKREISLLEGQQDIISRDEELIGFLEFILELVENRGVHFDELKKVSSEKLWAMHDQIREVDKLRDNLMELPDQISGAVKARVREIMA